jgi:hypothetical protein
MKIIPRGRSSIHGEGKILLLYTPSSPLLGYTQPPINGVRRDVSLGSKQLELQYDHLPPNSVEVKNKPIFLKFSWRST